MATLAEIVRTKIHEEFSTYADPADPADEGPADIAAWNFFDAEADVRTDKRQYSGLITFELFKDGLSRLNIVYAEEDVRHLFADIAEDTQVRYFGLTEFTNFLHRRGPWAPYTAPIVPTKHVRPQAKGKNGGRRWYSSFLRRNVKV